MASASGIRLGKVFVEIGADPSKLFGALNKLNKRIGAIGQQMTNFGGKMTAAGAALAVPIGLATRQFATFDDAIRATAAVTQATGAQLQAMNDRARELGATTSFTAVQVANLMTELGRAGFKPDEINEMTLSVLDLARATGTEASLSAKIMAETLRQFSMGAGDASRVADVLTLAANSTNNTVEGLGEALSYAGLNAAQAGMSIEDTAAILGALGNVGIQGSNAGTVLRRLVTIAGAEAEKLGEIFGVEALDAGGNVKPLIDVFSDIAEATNELPSGERLKKFNEAFGLLGITGAQALGGAVGDIRELRKSLVNAEATSNKTAKAMDAGLGGSMRIALSAIEGTQLALGEALAPSLQKVIDFIASLAGAVTRFVQQNEGLIVSIAKGVAIFTGIGVAIAGVGLTLGGFSAAMAPLIAISSALTVGLAGVVGSVFSVAAALLAGIGAAASYMAANVAAAGATAAAWMAANAPFIALAAAGAALAAIAFVVFDGFSLVQDVAGGLGAVVGGVVEVFNSLLATATQTFGGIYDAITAGDLGMAFEILLAGWNVAWAKGSEALLNGIDYLSSTMYEVLAIAFTQVSAVVMGTMDNLVNGVMAAFDAMVSAVRKSWNWVQSFLRKGYDLAAENRKVDDEMSAKRRDRAANRPGIQKRLEDGMAGYDEARAAREETQAAVQSQRAAGSAAAQANLDALTGQAAATRADVSAASTLQGDLGGVKTMEDLGALGGTLTDLLERGNLTADREKQLIDAYNQASEKIGEAAAATQENAADMTKKADPKAMQDAALAAAAQQSEVVGTFSSVGLGGMGFGGNLQQQQLDKLGEIAENTKNMDGAAATD